jgi:hypothetical protein
MDNCGIYTIEYKLTKEHHVICDNMDKKMKIGRRGTFPVNCGIQNSCPQQIMEKYGG